VYRAANVGQQIATPRNIYSYVNNNPLTLKDPTGFTDCYSSDTCSYSTQWQGNVSPFVLNPGPGYSIQFSNGTTVDSLPGDVISNAYAVANSPGQQDPNQTSFLLVYYDSGGGKGRRVKDRGR
jgi:hypothetical protein